MEPETIETARLRLEGTRLDFAPQVWPAINSSLPELKKYMSWAANASLDHTAEFLHRAEAGWRNDTSWEFVIFENGEVAGTVGFNNVNGPWRSCNLGYWIRSDLAGRGYVSEAAAAAIDFAYGSTPMHRLEICAAIENGASWRIAEKLGFTREGVLRHGYWVEERPLDVYMYSLLKTDARS
jgi:ribosomal-protein-serine acetyltransferase